MKRVLAATALALIALNALAGGARSGSAYLGADLKRMQDDAFANPGTLWITQGEELWREPQGAAQRACAECHGEPATLRGAAARYPRFDAALGRLVNLEGRINACRTLRQKAAPLPYESEPLLALTALVAAQSRGLPLQVKIDGPARSHFENGRRLFRIRIGQFNLSCTQCHDRNAGRRIGAETISEGHPNGFPAYRLQWQALGSLHRRLRACNSGVRAGMLPAGAPDYLDLELYLAWRARGLAIESPAVRR